MSHRIQEFAVPHLTEKDHRLVHRGYVEFFRRRGIDVGSTDGFRSRYSAKNRADAIKERSKMAKMFEDETKE